MLSHRAAEKHFFFGIAVSHRPHGLGKSPSLNHQTRELGGALDVVGRAGGHFVLAKGQLLGDASAIQTGELTLQRGLAVRVLVLLGQEHRYSERPPAGNDAHLVYRVMIGHQPADDGVTGFVKGSQALFRLAHHHRAALGAHHELVLGALEMLLKDLLAIFTSSKQGRLIDQVCQIGAGKTGSASGQYPGVYVGGVRHLAHVHLENLLAAAQIRQRHHHLAVEPPGSQQRRIEHIGPVGGGDDDDPFVALKTVHFHQQLVQCLLALVVSAAQAGAPVAADRVDFIDKDDAWRVFLGLFEHIPNSGGADANEHLHEIRSRDGEKRHTRLAGNGLGQQGLAGSRQPDHQNAARNLAAEPLEFARIFEEVHQFDDLLLGFFHTGNIGERHLDLILTLQARPGFAE